jgi:hypothetical protein
VCLYNALTDEGEILLTARRDAAAQIQQATGQRLEHHVITPTNKGYPIPFVQVEPATNGPRQRKLSAAPDLADDRWSPPLLTDIVTFGRHR